MNAWQGEIECSSFLITRQSDKNVTLSVLLISQLLFFSVGIFWAFRYCMVAWRSQPPINGFARFFAVLVGGR